MQLFTNKDKDKMVTNREGGITVYNNLYAFCYKDLSKYGGDVSGFLINLNTREVVLKDVKNAVYLGEGEFFIVARKSGKHAKLIKDSGINKFVIDRAGNILLLYKQREKPKRSEIEIRYGVLYAYGRKIEVNPMNANKHAREAASALREGDLGEIDYNNTKHGLTKNIHIKGYEKIPFFLFNGEVPGDLPKTISNIEKHLEETPLAVFTLPLKYFANEEAFKAIKETMANVLEKEEKKLSKAKDDAGLKLLEKKVETIQWHLMRDYINATTKNIDFDAESKMNNWQNNIPEQLRVFDAKKASAAEASRSNVKDNATDIREIGAPEKK